MILAGKNNYFGETKLRSLTTYSKRLNILLALLGACLFTITVRGCRPQGPAIVLHLKRFFKVSDCAGAALMREFICNATAGRMAPSSSKAQNVKPKAQTQNTPPVNLLPPPLLFMILGKHINIKVYEIGGSSILYNIFCQKCRDIYVEVE